MMEEFTYNSFEETLQKFWYDVWQQLKFTFREFKKNLNLRQQLTIKFLRDFSFTEYKFTQKMKKSVLIKTLQKEFLLSCCNGECSFVPNNWQHLAWDQKLTMHFINHIVICKTKDRCIKRWVSDHWKHQNSMVSIKIDNLFMFCHLHMHTFHFLSQAFFQIYRGI